jgi:sugar phosphate permease
MMILVSLVAWLSISFGSPFHLRLWGAMYPARRRGRIVGVIGTGRAAAGALAALAGGLIADQLGGPTALAIAGAVGAACAIAYAGFHAAAASDPPVFSARESIQALRDRPVLGRVAIAQGFYGGGFIAAAPLFALIYVDRLDLSLADVGVIGILTAASTTISFMAWGVVSDRSGPLAAMRIGTSLGLAGLLLYAVAPAVAVLWVASILVGAASSSIDVGIAAVVSEHTPLASRSAAMAGWNAITGARGIVAAFLMSALLQLGVVDVTTGLLLCAGATGIGVALYVRAEAHEPVAEPHAAPRAVQRGGIASVVGRRFAK